MHVSKHEMEPLLASACGYLFFVRMRREVTAIHRKLVKTYGEGCSNNSTVYYRVQAFWEGKRNLPMSTKVGDHMTVQCKENIETVSQQLVEDSCFVLGALTYYLSKDCNRMSVSQIS